MNRREKAAKKKRKRALAARPSRDASVRHGATANHVWKLTEVFVAVDGLVYGAECSCHRAESATVEYEELAAIVKGEPMPDVGREDERWEKRGETHALHVMFEDHQGFVCTLDKAYAEKAYADATAKGWTTATTEASAGRGIAPGEIPMAED